MESVTLYTLQSPCKPRDYIKIYLLLYIKVINEVISIVNCFPLKLIHVFGNILKGKVQEKNYQIYPNRLT